MHRFRFRFPDADRVVSWSLPLLMCCAVAVPRMCAADAQRLLVSSRNTHSIKAYDAATGQFLGDAVAPGLGGLNAPQDMLLGPGGTLLVSGRGNTAILEYDLAGQFLGTFTSGYALDNPTKMTLGPDGRIYVSQWGATKNRVARFDGMTGAFVDEFTSVGVSGGGGHAWDAAGNMYMAAFGSADVRKFGPTGQFLGVFSPPGLFGGPINVWFKGGHLFVADWTTGSVVRLDGQSGAYLSTFVNGLSNVEGFAYGVDGSLYLCDWTLNRIQHYDAAGQFLGVFANTGGMLQPNSLLFVPSNATPTRIESWGRLKRMYR